MASTGFEFDDREPVEPDLLGEKIPLFWMLATQYTARQAALLIVGLDPDGDIGANCEGWKPHEQPKGYGAVKQALKSALILNEVEGSFFPKYHYWDGEARDEISGSFDLEASIVNRESLVEWLRAKGVRTGFFFQRTEVTASYLDRHDTRYAPKLAAAVRAWQAVTDPNGKSPKQALVKWLREHAAEFGLSDEDGKPNETGIEEVAKVANWQPGGGAAKTPGT